MARRSRTFTHLLIRPLLVISQGVYIITIPVTYIQHGGPTALLQLACLGLEGSEFSEPALDLVNAAFSGLVQGPNLLNRTQGPVRGSLFVFV